MEYQRSRRAYIEGACSRIDAEQNLRRLGYRGQALKVEVLIWVAEQQRYMAMRGSNMGEASCTSENS